MRTELRIISGNLRGRKIEFDVDPKLRPTPHRVREALFSILGKGIAGVPFIDIFGGTGIIGLEALSRGSSFVTFVERDFQLGQAIEKYMKAFGVRDSGQVVSTDAYRWVARWRAPSERCVVYISPPFPDFKNHPDQLLGMMAQLQEKVAFGSVIVMQGEVGVPLGELPDNAAWDRRVYGRNELMFWVKEEKSVEAPENES